MSEFKVCFTEIRDISKHPNPEVLRLEIATIYGFQVVVKKDFYKIGDVVCYCPIDSILPKDLEDILFPADAKIKLSGSRIRQIKIQKFYSQGMLIDQAALRQVLKQRGLKSNIDFKLEHNYMELFKISKYEPPVPKFQQAGVKTRKSNNNNPFLHSYNGLSNIKWFPDLFQEGEEVVIQEKLHGTNARAGMLPTHSNTILRKIMKFFKLLPEYEFCYGSNNVELTNRSDFSNNFYGEDVYGNTLKKAGAKEKIKPMEVVYGEIIGEGIQKGYDYGHKADDKQFVIFDIKILQKDGSFRWLNPNEVILYGKERGFKVVPILYDGPYNKQLATELTLGNSVYCKEQKIREGVVVKSKFEYNDNSCSSQKKALKIINPVYLDDKNNTDFH